MSERDIHFLLGDIVEAIENILLFTNNVSFETYSSDLKTAHAVQHNFVIIGEAAARVSEEYKRKHPEVNWREIKDFRNVIVHEYFGVDHRIVWDIIHENLPQLKIQMLNLLSDNNTK